MNNELITMETLLDDLTLHPYLCNQYHQGHLSGEESFYRHSRRAYEVHYDTRRQFQLIAGGETIHCLPACLP